MARPDTIAKMIKALSTVSKFQTEDLKTTAEVYHQALNDLSDQQIEDATSSLLTRWTRTMAPKPSDIRQAANEFKPRLKQPPPRSVLEGRSHEDSLRQAMVDSYAGRVIRQVLGDKAFDRHPKTWTRAEWLKVSKAQAKERKRLGIPDPTDTVLRTKWAD